MGLVGQSEFLLAQSNVAARLSELRCERKLPTPAMIKPKLGDKKCTFSQNFPALKAPVSTYLVASGHETEDGSYVSRILAFEDVFMDSQDIIAKPWNLANVRCFGGRWRQIQRASVDSLFDEDAKVTVRRSDHVLNASSLRGIRYQKEDGMDAHLEVVGVGPRDSVNRLGDFAFEPCIYFFWALLCLLAKAVNAKHLHLEAPCVLSLSEPSPMSSREGSCVPTTPVRSSSPREVRLRSSTLSTPETPKRSPLVNIFRKMKHTRCSSSSDEEPPEAATEETLCRQSVFQRVNSPLRGRNNNTADNQAQEMPSTITVEGMEVSAEIFDGQGWATAMGRRRQTTPPNEELATGTIEDKNQLKHPRVFKKSQSALHSVVSASRLPRLPKD
ncbi:hypothetical protein HPB51_016641 [Rhipicephalus microplus]|uniref:Uncharacterized protein n=1 Tax=Rhipicephalus microplus TaxID=6941 RepID=A0A9J6EIA1_RHIMP|nr:hypothetical protein HPB51_016641 [Rhipicephalus microplus]